jgi:S-adenosylmethionine:tRNA ribosyltransferase-isomerase
VTADLDGWAGPTRYTCADPLDPPERLRVRTDDFDYDLPTGRIAQSPADPRDSCRLLVLHRDTGLIEHRVFADIGDYLRRGDLLVVNETRVLPARLRGVKLEGGAQVEFLLLRERGADTWECLARPGRRLKPGARVAIGDGDATALVVGASDESGTRLVQFQATEGRFIDVLHRLGEVPLPPYITRPLADPEEYQTVYATDERSAAAPTAGLHFTTELLDGLVREGVHVARIELDVGIDTFRPVSEDDPELHRIHTEHYRVDEQVAAAIAECRERGGRVVAVGTTSARSLESAWSDEDGAVRATEGNTSLFILPGYRFRAVDAMITNFHIPRSTLLMMISAFAGRENVMRAYETALAEGYRFLSFGDAMLIA